MKIIVYDNWAHWMEGGVLFNQEGHITDEEEFQCFDTVKGVPATESEFADPQTVIRIRELLTQ